MQLKRIYSKKINAEIGVENSAGKLVIAQEYAKTALKELDAKLVMPGEQKEKPKKKFSKKFSEKSEEKN